MSTKTFATPTIFWEKGCIFWQNCMDANIFGHDYNTEQGTYPSETAVNVGTSIGSHGIPGITPVYTLQVNCSYFSGQFHMMWHKIYSHVKKKVHPVFLKAFAARIWWFLWVFRALWPCSEGCSFWYFASLCGPHLQRTGVVTQSMLLSLIHIWRCRRRLRCRSRWSPYH